MEASGLEGFPTPEIQLLTTMLIVARVPATKRMSIHGGMKADVIKGPFVKV